MTGQPAVAGGIDSGPGSRTTIVTQTQVRPEAADAFRRWQEETSRVIATAPGFLEQTVMPTRPPEQVDWVILQRFASGPMSRPRY